MAARRMSMNDVREVIRRLRLGQSERAIARDLGCGRNTVACYRGLAAAHDLLEGPLPTEAELSRLLADRRREELPAQEQSLVEPHREQVRRLVEAGVEAKAIWQLLCEERGFRGSYSSVRRFVRKLRAASAPASAVVRVEVAPGEEAQVDFGYGGMQFDPELGVERRAWVFVMVLSHSRHQYAELAFDQSIATWTRLHVAAFEFFGGVPGRIVLDNLKAAIVRASLEDPEMQRSYRDLCEHYGLVASPCRPRTPEHKGKVEKGGVHYVKRNALAGRSFRDVHEANKHLLRWCQEVAGRRVHGTTRRVPLELFEEVEREALQPLPPTAWEQCEWKEAKLNRDCHVWFQSSYYSAPHRLVGKRLMVRATERQVQLFHDHALVATHRRATSPGTWRTQRDHFPPDKARFLTETPQWCLERAASIGPRTRKAVERLLGDRPLDRRRSAQRLLRLAEHYGSSRLEAACARALAFGDVRHSTVKNILRGGLELLPLPEPGRLPSSAATPRHARAWWEFFPQQRRSSWN